jgi:fluoroquinolone transport system permease protein
VLATFLRFELTRMLRDEMTRAMVLYPVVLGGLVRLLDRGELLVGPIAAITAVVLVVLAAGFDFGMIVGLSLLDDRDDDAFASIGVSPVPLALYVWTKVGFGFVMAVLAGVAAVLVAGTPAIGPLPTLLVVLLAAAQVPINAFLINVLAADRAQGIAAVKLTGVLVLGPVVAWFLTDWRAWIFAVVPGFWPAKAVQSLLLGSAPSGAGPGFAGYLGFGLLWCALLTALTCYLFSRRATHR